MFLEDKDIGVRLCVTENGHRNPRADPMIGIVTIFPGINFVAESKVKIDECTHVVLYP